MAFDWDVARPTDSSIVSAFPSNERDFRVDARASVDVEHNAEEGRHKFGVGTTAARDAITNWSVGSIWFNTDRVAGKTLMDVVASIGPVVWVETAFGLTDSQNVWEALQVATYFAITVNSVPSPDEITINCANGNYHKVLLLDDTLLLDLVNPPTAGDGTQIVLEVQQATPGGQVMTFGSGYEFSFGNVPVLSTGDAKIDILILMVRSDGQVHVTISNDSSA